jgi:hypothetical protein
MGGALSLVMHGAYQDVGRAAEATRLHEQTRADRERVLGPDHPDTLTSQYSLSRSSARESYPRTILMPMSVTPAKQIPTGRRVGSSSEGSPR